MFGSKILKGIVLFVVTTSVCIPVKADVHIKWYLEPELKITDEQKIGDFEDRTEEPLIPLITPLEQEMLQKIAIAEAGNVSVDTMAYVMQTVLNRVYDSDFPDTISEVISEKGQFSTYPTKYNKAEVNQKSIEAFMKLNELNNNGQLYFENTVPGSWQSSNLQFIFKSDGVSFYK